MARYKNYNNRNTLRYDMKREEQRMDRMLEKMENQAIRATLRQKNYGNAALAEKIKEFKENNSNLTKKQLAKGIKEVKTQFKAERDKIVKSVKKEQEETLNSLRKLVSNTPFKYKLINDDLDPGITLVGKAKSTKNSTVVYDDKELKGFHKDMEDNFFKRIHNAFDVMSDGKQSVTKFVQDTQIINEMNHANVKTKVYQGPQSIRETWNHIKDSGFVVGYDLETIGGKNQHGIWEPTAITEYSFQTLNVHNIIEAKKNGVSNWDDPANDILKKNITKDVTAVMGISKEQADNIYKEIELAIKNGTIKERNDLWVTANRMMKYGNDKTRFEKGADGLTRAVDFVDEDAVNNVFNLDTIKKGLQKHVDVYNNAKTIDGIKDYEWHFLNTIADIKKKDYAVMGFNDAFFDSPIMDSQLNKIVSKYKSNETAMAAIQKMFDGLPIEFNPAANRRLDGRALIGMATEAKGYEVAYGKGMNEFMNQKALKGSMLARQEYMVEHHFPNMFNTGTAHLAVEDVSNLLRLGFAPSDKLGGQSLFESAFAAMDEAYPEMKNSVLSFDPKVDKILYSKRPTGSATYTGRGVLGFSIDRTTGAVKTSAGFNIGGNNNALGDVSKQNIVTGGTISPNQFYKFGGVQKIELTDDFIEEANKHMPEYARKHMYAVRLDSYMSDEFKHHEGANKSTVLFFNEMAEAEAHISQMFTYMGDYDKSAPQSYTQKEAQFQVFGRDTKKIMSIYEDKEDINLDELTVSNRKKDGLIFPKKLKKSKGYKLDDSYDYSIIEAKDYNNTKGYTFTPKRFGGEYAREGVLLRSRSNKDIKYVNDPETGKYHAAKVVAEQVKDKKGRTKNKYNLQVDTSSTVETDLPKDLEIVYNRKKVFRQRGRRYETGTDKMMPLYTTKDHKGYYVKVLMRDDDDVLYYDYFVGEADKTLVSPLNLKYYTEDELGGLIKPATKIYNPDDKRFELQYVGDKTVETINSKGAFKINENQKDEVIDILTSVTMEDKNKFSVNDVGELTVQISKSFEDARSIKSERTVVDRARRHAMDNLYKRSQSYAKLIDTMEQNGLGHRTKTADQVKEYLIEVSNGLAKNVANNQPIAAEHHLVLNALGFKNYSLNSAQNYLYGSTLSNYIEGNDLFFKRNAGMNRLYGFIAQEQNLGVSQFSKALLDKGDYNTKTVVSGKFEAMYDYLLNQAATDLYKTPEEIKEALTLAGKKYDPAIQELKSYYEFDISNLGKKDGYVKKTVHNVDNSTLRVGLKSGDEYKLVDKVFKLYYGDYADEAIDGRVRKASAMKKFITDISKRNHRLFKTEPMKELLEEVNKGMDGGSISPEYIATKFIKNLQQEKEQDFMAGIIKTDFNIASLFESDNKVIAKVNEYLQDDEMLKKAYKSTSLFRNVHENDKMAIEAVVDKYFMPTFNGLTGKQALEAIQNQGIYTAKQSKVMAINWQHARESHIDNVGRLFNLVSQGGGNIHFNSTGINVEINGEMFSFDGLAKTRYSNGTLEHVVSNSKVAAHLNMGWDAKTKSFKAQSNLKDIFANSYSNFNLKKISEAIDAGEFDITMLKMFTGAVQGKALEEAVISNYNLHELNTQFRFGLGDSIGKHLEELIGTENNPGRWGTLETIDKDAIARIRKIVTSDNWKNGNKEITPELKELLVKNMIPMLQQTENDDELEWLLSIATFSNKDTQVANASTDVHLGERYSQRWLDNFDNAQRPVTAAQKMVFDKKKLDKGIANYIKETGGSKDIFSGALMDESATRALKTLGGVMIEGAEQAITMGKTNVGQIALQAILENNFEKVINSNNTIENLDRHQKILQYEKMKKKMNLFEQEKVMDARLMDAVFEMSSNKQNISDNYDFVSWLTTMDDRSGVISESDSKIAKRLAKVQSEIMLDDSGKITYTSAAGELVDRGEAIMKHIGFGDKETTINSKQIKGRLKFGVFEKNGGMQLSDEQVSEFLQRNIKDIQRLAESYGDIGGDKIHLASNEILSQYFNTGYYVADMRQKTYMKVMNEGVEKDMTYGLYSGLGEIDTRIGAYLNNATYQEKKLSKFKGDVLTLSEIDEIFVKNFDVNAAEAAGLGEVFKNGEDLKKAILAERYYDSKNVFDYIDEFKKSSLLTTHAVAKHNNSGMIFENIVGSAFSIYKKEYGEKKALEVLRKNLIDYKVIDMFDDKGEYVDEILTIQNGKLIHKAIKSNNAELQRDVLKTVETLNIENLMNMIKDDKDDNILKDALYHEKVKVFDESSESKYSTKDVYGDIVTTDLSYTDKATGVVKQLKNIVVGTHAQTSAELAIDPEYMTVYDYSTLKGLENKAAIDREIVSNKVKIQQLENKKRELVSRGGSQADIDSIQEDINKLLDINKDLKIDKSQIAEELGDMTNISKGKKIGHQEFFLYDMRMINSSSGEAVAEFMEKNMGIDDAVMKAFKDSYAGILTDDFKVEEEYQGYRVLQSYTNRLKQSKLYNLTGTGLRDEADLLKGTDIRLTEEMLELDEYKHLKNIYGKIKDVVGAGLGADVPISVRYAEEAFQIDAAHKAYKFNKTGNLISKEALEDYGFENINIRDLVVTGEAAENLGIDSMFTKNYLVDLGEFGQLALPKAGQIAGDQDIKAKFQSSMIGIQKDIKELDQLYATEDSEAADKLRSRIRGKIDTYQDNLRSAIYDKHGMLYDAGKVEVQESFRAKSSTATVFSDIIRGINAEQNDIALEEAIGVISSKTGNGKSLLDKARINGHSITDWEKKGVYHDYMFASKDIFEELGYFENARMANYFGVDEKVVAENVDEYVNKMTDALQTHGDIFMGERYPAIWIGSDKPMRVFLDNETTKTNRIRLSLATMLSMNGDNDGDSISASLIRTQGGNNYLKYAIEREKYITNNADADVKQIDAAMVDIFGAEDAKFFKALNFNMSTEAITANAHFHKKGMGDMVEELQTAIANGNLNSVKAVKFNSMYGGRLYANYGGTSSMENINKNLANVNDMIEKATVANEEFKKITGSMLRKEGDGYSLKVNDKAVGDYTDHLNENFKIFDAMQSPDNYKLSAEQKSALAKIQKDMGITDEAINNMREDAVIHARWMDYNSETMAKARKGSIGPINVALQQHRRAALNLYDDPNSVEDYAKKLLVQHISKEVEQEVISSKKGNVVYNMTKTTDLIDIYRQAWSQGTNSTINLRDINGNVTSTTVDRALAGWMNDNLDDKKIKEIITGMENSSAVGKKYVKETFGFNAGEITKDNIATVREKVTGTYVSTLRDLNSSDYAKAVRSSSRQGGNMVDDASVVALDSFNNLNDMMSQILTHGEDRYTNTRARNTGIVNMATSEKTTSLVADVVDKAIDMKIAGKSGLAVGALGFATGMLVSGFAGGPVDQKSASDYAQEERKPQAVSVPTMMDQGGFATTGGGSGYVINVRANSNKDLKSTKKALRYAASASTGGGVSVNMNIKDKTQQYSEYDLEQMIAGIF